MVNLLDQFTFFHNWIFPGPEGRVDKLFYNPDSLRLFSNSSPPRDMTRYLLKEMKLECQRQQAKFLIFSTVDGAEFCATHEHAPEAPLVVLQWCRDMEINTTDLFPLFHKEILATHNDFFAKDRFHWNFLGHQLAAQVVLDSLHSLFAEDSTRMNSLIDAEP